MVIGIHARLARLQLSFHDPWLRTSFEPVTLVTRLLEDRFEVGLVLLRWLLTGSPTVGRRLTIHLVHLIEVHVLVNGHIDIRIILVSL